MRIRGAGSVKSCEAKSGGLRGPGHIFCVALSILIMAFGAAGCGKKGPPVPPDALPLPVAGQLAGELSGDLLTLSWKIPEHVSFAKPDGFYVYRSKTAAGDDCENCPYIFEKVSEVSARGGFFRGLAEKATYRETLEKGHIYRYKVMAYTDGGLTGDWSEVVEVSY